MHMVHAPRRGPTREGTADIRRRGQGDRRAVIIRATSGTASGITCTGARCRRAEGIRIYVEIRGTGRVGDQAEAIHAPRRDPTREAAAGIRRGGQSNGSAGIIRAVSGTARHIARAGARRGCAEGIAV